MHTVSTISPFFFTFFEQKQTNKQKLPSLPQSHFLKLLPFPLSTTLCVSVCVREQYPVPFPLKAVRAPLQLQPWPDTTQPWSAQTHRMQTWVGWGGGGGHHLWGVTVYWLIGRLRGLLSHHACADGQRYSLCVWPNENVSGVFVTDIFMLTYYLQCYLQFFPSTASISISWPWPFHSSTSTNYILPRATRANHLVAVKFY